MSSHIQLLICVIVLLDLACVVAPLPCSIMCPGGVDVTMGIHDGAVRCMEWLQPRSLLVSGSWDKVRTLYGCMGQHGRMRGFQAATTHRPELHRLSVKRLDRHSNQAHGMQAERCQIVDSELELFSPTHTAHAPRLPHIRLRCPHPSTSVDHRIAGTPHTCAL